VPPTPAKLVDTTAGHDEGGHVMFCVRVSPSLRRRVKLAAVGSGRTIQELTVEALEEACARVEG
jgi:predicted HicB family RNase H-like nuclease